MKYGYAYSDFHINSISVLSNRFNMITICLEDNIGTLLEKHQCKRLSSMECEINITVSIHSVCSLRYT